MILESITIEVLSALIILGILGIGTFCTYIFKTIQKHNKNQQNFTKAFLLFIQLTEEETKRLHPEYEGTMLETIKLILEEE